MSRRTRLSLIATILSLAVLGVWIVACDGSDSPTGLKQGTLRVEMKDQPAELAEVNVYIAGLTVKRVDNPVVQIATDIGRVDLLTIVDTPTLLATAAVTPGQYEFIMIDLDESQSGVLEVGAVEEEPLQIPSEEIKVLAGFEVREDGTTTLTLDFDAAASLMELPTGEWLMTPVIIMENVDVD